MHSSSELRVFDIYVELSLKNFNALFFASESEFLYANLYTRQSHEAGAIVGREPIGLAASSLSLRKVDSR